MTRTRTGVKDFLAADRAESMLEVSCASVGTGAERLRFLEAEALVSTNVASGRNARYPGLDVSNAPGGSQGRTRRHNCRDCRQAGVI